MAKPQVRTIAALILGAGAFAGSFILLFPGNLGLGLLVGLGGIIVGSLAFGGKPKSVPTMLADGLSKVDFELAMKEAQAKYRDLSNEAFKIRNMEVRKKVDQVADVVKRILENIKKNPGDIRQARQFLDYYLDATVKIVKRYVELYDKGQGQGDIKESLTRVEDTLEQIRAAFEKQLSILLENDKLDLDTELTVLKRTIELEGLTEYGSKK